MCVAGPLRAEMIESHLIRILIIFPNTQWKRILTRHERTYSARQSTRNSRLLKFHRISMIYFYPQACYLIRCLTQIQSVPKNSGFRLSFPFKSSNIIIVWIIAWINPVDSHDESLYSNDNIQRNTVLNSWEAIPYAGIPWVAHFHPQQSMARLKLNTGIFSAQPAGHQCQPSYLRAHTPHLGIRHILKEITHSFNCALKKHSYQRKWLSFYIEFA